MVVSDQAIKYRVYLGELASLKVFRQASLHQSDFCFRKLTARRTWMVGRVGFFFFVCDRGLVMLLNLRREKNS